MANQPRRTCELQPGSTRKTAVASANERKSRIALSVKKLDPRASSNERPFTTPLKTPRTPSTPATAARTPQTASRTGMSERRGTNQLDPRYHGRVLDFIIEKAIFGPDNNLKNLRNLSFKNFQVLVDWLLKQLTDDMSVQGPTFVEDLSKTLIYLEYPYQMNKSWLKTPTAGHAFNHSLQMLNWMVDLVDPERALICEGDRERAQATEEFDLDEDFGDLEYQKYFNEAVKSGFQLWDKQKDEEFAALETEMCNKLIRMMTRDKISSESQLLEEIEGLKSKKAELEVIVKPSGDMELLGSLKSETEKLSGILERLKISVEFAMKEKEDVLRDYREQLSTLKSYQSRVEVAEREVSEQKMTVEQKDRLVQENFLKKVAVEEHEAWVQKFEEENAQSAVTFARLTKKKLDKIMELNLLINQVAKVFPSDLNSSVLEVYPNSSSLRDDIQSVQEALGGVEERLTQLVSERRQEKFELLAKETKLSAECQEKTEIVKKFSEMVLTNASRMGSKMKALALDIEKQGVINAKLEEREKELDAQIKQVEAKRVRTEAEAKEVDTEKQAVMQKFLADQREIIAAKARENEKIEKEVQKAEAELAESDRRLETLSGELQSLINSTDLSKM